MNETIKVDKLSPYGFLSGKEYVNWSKKFPEEQKAYVVPGRSLEFDVFVAESGKRYVNKLAGPINSAPVVKAETPVELKKTSVDTDRAKKFTPKFTKKDDGMSKEEWAAKDQRISRQGCIQVAVQVTQGNFTDAIELANKMLEFVNEVK